MLNGYAIQTNEFWEHITLSTLEKVRRQLRCLTRFIDKDEKKIVYTNFEDKIGTGIEIVISSAEVSLAQYRKKVEHFIKSHEDQATIQKLKYNRPITEKDLMVLEELLYEASGLASKEKYKKVFASGKPLGHFVRELIGLDRAAAKEAFADFLNEAKYNSKQIEFINQIIEFLTANGVMENAMLFDPPFTDIHEKSAYGYFDDDEVESLLGCLAFIKNNAMPNQFSSARY